ncbi:MAG: hypothetical protein OXF63_11105 [Anaerolineaceae bacterium]|nr:hypothetical protein [Anaerolineaceae bacterium]
MKPVMRGLAIVAALLLASVAGVAAQGVSADDCSVREWLLPLQQPLQDYEAAMAGLQTGVAAIEDPEDPLALVGVMQALQRANQAFIDEAAGIIGDCNLQNAVEDYLNSPVVPNPAVAGLMEMLQLDQESGVAESCWRTPGGEALSAFYSRGLENLAVAEALAEEANAGNLNAPPDLLVVTYGAALGYNRALDDIDFDCAAAGADSDGRQEDAAATRAQPDSAAQGDPPAKELMPLCGVVQDKVDQVDTWHLDSWLDTLPDLRQTDDIMALTNLMVELKDIIRVCQHGAIDAEAELWLYTWEEDPRGDRPELHISVAANFGIDEYDFEATVRAGVRSEEVWLNEVLFAGDPPVELCCGVDRIRQFEVEFIAVTVEGILNEPRYFRCELSEQQDEVDVYACTER